jgi:predicted phosphohydrolase
MDIYTIADLHFKTLLPDKLQTLAENWPGKGDVVVVAGDTDEPLRLEKWPFSRTENIVIGGNTDPEKLQRKYTVRVLGDDLTILGHMGANWIDTPWAHHHLYDQPSDYDVVFSQLLKAVRQVQTTEILLALHYPPCYTFQNREFHHPAFVDLIRSDSRIKNVLVGHVHEGCGEVPSNCAQAEIHLVSADRLGWRPRKLLHV